MSILSVDYHSKQAPKLFSQSLRETGFAVLQNHPISTDLIGQAYQQWKNFFNKKIDFKNKYLFEKSTQAGYFPFRTENAKDRQISDLKEFYHVYLRGQIPPEQYDVSLDVYYKLQGLAAELLQWVEDELPDDVAEQLSMPLRNMINNSPNTLLRILHYPPLSDEYESDAVRAAAHEDINLITLLPAATAPGLEVLDVNGNWHGVNCDPGNIVVNVGDMLQMCTQYYYKSTTHRVINPHDGNKNTSRYSMPLFLHPHPEVKLSSTQTAVEYLHQRLREIGIY